MDASKFLDFLANALIERGFEHAAQGVFRRKLVEDNEGKVVLQPDLESPHVLYIQSLYYLEYPTLTNLLLEYLRFESKEEFRPMPDEGTVSSHGMFGGTLFNLFKGAADLDQWVYLHDPQNVMAASNNFLNGIDTVLIPLLERLSSPHRFLFEFEEGTLPEILKPTLRSTVLLYLADGRISDALALVGSEVEAEKARQREPALRQCARLKRWIVSTQDNPN